MFYHIRTCPAAPLRIWIHGGKSRTPPELHGTLWIIYRTSVSNQKSFYIQSAYEWISRASSCFTWCLSKWLSFLLSWCTRSWHRCQDIILIIIYYRPVTSNLTGHLGRFHCYCYSSCSCSRFHCIAITILKGVLFKHLLHLVLNLYFLWRIYSSSKLNQMT